MKQLGYRSVMVLVFIALLGAGTLLFAGKYAAQGGEWAASRVNQASSSAKFFDRSGVLLYDKETGDYAADAAVRKATLHLIGDRAGNILSLRRAMASQLSGFHPITGTTLGGYEVTLTVDAGLCTAAYAALNGAKGAAAVYNYQTGEVLCMVSSPAFDPENPPAITEGDAAYEGVYINRVLSGLYVPGSVFKLVTTAAALERLEDISERSFTCTGSVSIGGQTVTCPYAHGELKLSDALAKSCNCVYAALTVELGGETMADYVSQLGLDTSFSVSGMNTAAGSYIVTEDEGDLGWSGVGQDQDMVNPCAMLRLMGAIANGGEGVTPTLLARAGYSGGLPALNLSIGRSSGERLLASDTAAELKVMMRNNVRQEYGDELFGGLAVCAKSGTAEVGENQRPHAWFVGFVDDETLPLAFVVVVENGGSGTSVAGSIAAKILAAAAESGLGE